MRRTTVCLLAIAAVLAAACASNKVLAPPRVDLARYETVGMLQFSSNGSDDLAKMASGQMMAVIQAAQPGVPILELGDSKGVLTSLKRSELDPETVKAIGKKYGVDAILVGELTTQQARPKFSVNSAIESMKASADIEGVLRARILLTGSGATVWNNAARGKRSVARVNMSPGGLPQIGARDPGDAESQLVRSLVVTLSDDFKSRWVSE